MTENVPAAEIARRFGVTRAAVSQWVSAGKLAGCYRGDGKDRRFDPVKVAAALGKTDPGQRLGNGAAAEAARRNILAQAAQAPGAAPAGTPPPPPSSPAPESSGGDLDLYQQTRAALAVEELRRRRRQNAEDEGRFVLASSAADETRRVIAREIAQVETFLKVAARRLADEFSIEARAALKVIMDEWRAHRQGRAAVLEAEAEAAGLTEAEAEVDI